MFGGAHYSVNLGRLARYQPTCLSLHNLYHKSQSNVDNNVIRARYSLYYDTGYMLNNCNREIYEKGPKEKSYCRLVWLHKTNSWEISLCRLHSPPFYPAQNVSIF